ncbi:hypothetical protein D3C85_1652890 [compost metagenome]
MCNELLSDKRSQRFRIVPGSCFFQHGHAIRRPDHASQGQQRGVATAALLDARVSAERHLAASVESAEESPLRSHRERGWLMLELAQQVQHERVVAAALDAQRSLPNGREA